MIFKTFPLDLENTFESACNHCERRSPASKRGRGCSSLFVTVAVPPSTTLSKYDLGSLFHGLHYELNPYHLHFSLKLSESTKPEPGCCKVLTQIYLQWCVAVIFLLRGASDQRCEDLKLFWSSMIKVKVLTAQQVFRETEQFVSNVVLEFPLGFSHTFFCCFSHQSFGSYFPNSYSSCLFIFCPLTLMEQTCKWLNLPNPDYVIITCAIITHLDIRPQKKEKKKKSAVHHGAWIRIRMAEWFIQWRREKSLLPNECQQKCITCSLGVAQRKWMWGS